MELNKNKIRTGLTSRRTSNSEHISDYHKIILCPHRGRTTTYYRIFSLTWKY